ncbi:VWA domain-containing protein [Olivibacter ginsenosidimutans]|uniref:VWA domain-containing protein n=2 Tax=Olivibacter ginsenosidimutans TaxID=1176537 RepID=A0ABP9BYT0_9SPHI
MLFLLFFSLVSFTNSNDRIISGTVYSQADQQALPGVSVIIEGASKGVMTDQKGHYTITISSKDQFLVFQYIGFKTTRVPIGPSNTLDVQLQSADQALDEVVVVGAGRQKKSRLVGSSAYGMAVVPRGVTVSNQVRIWGQPRPTETYQKIKENGFTSPIKEPLSTFAVDVDAASYSNVRRFINNGELPPKDAVRVEEMINYFQYDLKGPSDNRPVAISTELSQAPWNPQHQLLRVALKAKSVDTDKLPPSNFVFLIDVSGSMAESNRLPLVKTSLKMLVDQLRDKDKVALVTYAGTAGIKLESTPGNQKMKIKDAIDDLSANGSTAGGAGIKMAYKLAREQYIKEGNNRIILASDGDFNVGPSSDEDMEELITEERESGINLSILGFGMVNLKDSKMEIMADKGRGNYAYIDNLSEARKAIITEFGGTLFTVAKDVKIQVEFNPAKVQAYRLLGYENRLLESKDFNNDQKIGGDMGVGHSVTAYYEIVPFGVRDNYAGNVDPLKYQTNSKPINNTYNHEIAQVKFRYKEPGGQKSKLEQLTIADKPIDFHHASADFRFASAVAELGMLLRNSEYKQQADYDRLIARAKAAKGTDEEGYRAEFIRLAESAKLLARSKAVANLGEY